MTDHQFRVIADRDKGDDVYSVKREPFDRVTYGPLGYDVVRIERPVPTTDAPNLTDRLAELQRPVNGHRPYCLSNQPGDGACNCDMDQHSSVPTREQIALDAEHLRVDVASLLLNRQYNGRNEVDADAFYEGVTSDEQDDALATADAVLALLQEGGER